LAVSATGRIPILPDVPAIAEAFPGFEAQSWVGMLAPAGTSSAIIRQLNAGIAKVLAEPEIRRLFEDQGFEVLGSSAEVFEKWLAAQSEKWGRVIRERKITLGAALDPKPSFKRRLTSV
jgi:tripartite-type tricarboxylate transporter receptor subunit TctC